MAYLIGSADTARFSSTYAINSGAGATGFHAVGDAGDTLASATGTAHNLHLYINSWGTQTNIKACIYDETAAGALLETVIIPSSAGTGVISIPLAGTTTLTSGNSYRLGIYTEDADPVTFYSDTAGLFFRRWSVSGSYTTPVDPSNQTGGFDSNNEFYFAIDDVPGGGSNSVTTSNIPYVPVTGQDYEDLSTPVNTAGTFGELYTGSAFADQDQVVHDTNLTGDATVTLDSDAQGYWILSGTPSTNSTAGFYRIDSTGTVDVEDNLTFTVDAGADTTPPVITVTGSTSIRIDLNEAYVELGATWTDDTDGTGAATVGGDTVDHTTAGVYTVTYDYTDAAGNAAVQRTRIVRVGGAVSALLRSDFPATEVNTAGALQQPLIELHALCRRSSPAVARQIENYVDTVYDAIKTGAVVGTAPDATTPSTVTLGALYSDFVTFTRVERIKIDRAFDIGSDAVRDAIAAQLQFWLEQQGWTFV